MSARSILEGLATTRQTAVEMVKSPHAVPLWAAWSQGLRELGNTFGKAFPDTPQEPALGQIGQPTPGEVTAAKGVTFGPHDVPAPNQEKNGPELDLC